MALEYSKKVLDNFYNPKNMGEIKNADGVGTVGNELCGDIMQVYIKVEKNSKGEEIIKDVKFKAFGCAAAISTSSVITQLAKGKTIKAAKRIGMKEITESLGGLPKIKIHCSSMAEKALKKAIEDYEARKNSKILIEESL